MKKLLSILLAMMLLVATFAGCTAPVEEAAPAAEPETSDAEAPAEDAEADTEVDISGTTITAMVLQSQYIEQLQDMVFKFEEEYGVTVDATVVPDDQYLGILEMRIANGEMPDFVQYNAPHIYNVIDAEAQLYDFSGEPWTEALVDASVTEYNGKQYAFPFKATSGYHSIIYNKGIFDELGLTEPTTVEEFDKLCEDLLAAGKTPVYLTSDMWVPQIWTASGFSRAFGEAANAEEMTEAIFTGQAKFSDYPELVAVLDDLLAMRDKGYFNEDLATLTWDDAWLQMADGEGAMIMGEGPMVGQFQATYPDVEYGVFNVPTSYDTEATWLSGAQFSSSFVVNKDSENIEAIKVMFNEFATPEYSDMYFSGANAGFPAFEGVNGGDMNEDVRATYDEYVAAGTIVPEMNSHWGAIESLFSDYLWAYYAEALVGTDMTGADVLDKFQEDFDKFMANNGVEGF